MPDGGLPEAKFVYFYHSDHLGSTSYVTDKDGELYEHMQYFPFGETWIEQSSNTERLPYLYMSKEFDQETGLYYFGARYYDPRTSVWGGVDPALGEFLGRETPPGSFRLATYAYGFNSPVRLVDPDGQEPVAVPAVGPMGLLVFVGAALFVGSASSSGREDLQDPSAAQTGAALIAAGLAAMAAEAMAIRLAAIAAEKQAAAAAAAAAAAKEKERLAALAKREAPKVAKVVKQVTQKVKAPASSGAKNWQGTKGPGGTAGDCAKVMQANLTKIPGSKPLLGGSHRVNHWATQLKDGRVVDPTLRDNLAAWGVKYDDIPANKTVFSRSEWNTLQGRFPTIE